jgi:hypothetical protein
MKPDKSDESRIFRIGLCCAKAGIGHWLAPFAAKAAAAFAITQTNIRINEVKNWLESAGDLAAFLLPVARNAERSALAFLSAGA